MTQRHLTIPHKFIIYTDHVKMRKLVKGDNVEVRKVPFHDYQGWWNKLTLFSPEANLEGESLYLDLDVVITDNIDSFFTYEKDSKVVLMRDFNLTTKSFNSSIMRFNNEVMTPCVWDLYQSEKKKFDRMQGDQNVISDCIKPVPAPDEPENAIAPSAGVINTSLAIYILPLILFFICVKLLRCTTRLSVFLSNLTSPKGP